MPLPLLIYNLVIIAVLLVLLGIVGVNLAILPSIKDYEATSAETEAPSVAVLVPARNEETNIGGCLRALLSQKYPGFEVWLYDDASQDRTLQLAESIAAEDSRLHIVRGESEPPPGWLGKPNACQQLYMAMRACSNPEYLLFTDADVRLGPGALADAIRTSQAFEAGLLSVFPRQITGTWAERLSVPLLLHWTVYSFLPLPLAFSSRTAPAFAAANGQFMLFTARAYEACGGHAAVRSSVLEDVALSRAVKAAGYRVQLADSGPNIITRMYSTAGEVWRGYSKNAFAFFGYSPLFLVLGIIALLALYVVPPMLALYALVTAQYLLVLIAVAQYALAVLARLLLAWRFSYRLADCLLHPAAVLFVIAIALNSLRWRVTGKGEWKGRGDLRQAGHAKVESQEPTPRRAKGSEFKER